MTDAILEGLTKHRERLVAEVRRTEATMQRLLADIEHLDATIQQFDPTHRAVSPAVNPVGSGNRITRTVLTILRKAPGPMTLRQVAVSLMTTVGLDTRDRKRIRRMMEQVRTALARQCLNGTVSKEIGLNRAMMWKISR